MRRQQRGLALLDVLFAIALLGLVLAGYVRFQAIQKEKHAAADYRSRIEHVIEALQKYQYQQHTATPPVDVIDEFPMLLNDLMTPEEQFWINCSDAQEAARNCIQPDYVPWTTQSITYEAGRKSITVGADVRDIAYAEMTFPLSPATIAPTYRAKWATELLKVPYAKEDSAGDIVITVYDPLISQLYDEFLQRDGSVMLTDDWDVGGDYGITNTQELTIANSDGTQKIVSQGLVDIYTVEHGDWVMKPSCPDSTFPQIALGIGNIYINKDFELTGSQKPYLLSERTDAWQVGLEVRVKSLLTGELKKSNLGEINAFTQCK